MKNPAGLEAGRVRENVDVNRILNYLPASLVKHHVGKPGCGLPPSEALPDRNSRMRKPIPEQDGHRAGCGCLGDGWFERMVRVGGRKLCTYSEPVNRNLQLFSNHFPRVGSGERIRTVR
jgi:hypothetical protein